MKSFTSKLLAFFAFAVLCTVFFPQATEAKPNIVYHVQRVSPDAPGEATIEGCFENLGNETAYAKWIDLDLSLMTDSEQQRWQDFGMRHYTDVEVPAHSSVGYTFVAENPALQEYHGKIQWKCVANTHWERGAG